MKQPFHLLEVVHTCPGPTFLIQQIRLEISKLEGNLRLSHDYTQMQGEMFYFGLRFCEIKYPEPVCIIIIIYKFVILCICTI